MNKSLLILFLQISVAFAAAPPNWHESVYAIQSDPKDQLKATMILKRNETPTWKVGASFWVVTHNGRVVKATYEGDYRPSQAENLSPVASVKLTEAIDWYKPSSDDLGIFPTDYLPLFIGTPPSRMRTGSVKKLLLKGLNLESQLKKLKPNHPFYLQSLFEITLPGKSAPIYLASFDGDHGRPAQGYFLKGSPTQASVLKDAGPISRIYSVVELDKPRAFGILCLSGVEGSLGFWSLDALGNTEELILIDEGYYD